MNRRDLIDLQAHRSHPSLSILLPTHRTAPDNRRDPILLKNLVTEATNRLEAEVGKRGAAPLLRTLEAQIAGVDLQHALDGLAIFVSAEHAGAYLLPVPLEPRVVIDETFATRDLVFAMNRSPRYWVLALSEQPTRLYEGARETLLEVRGGGFPMTHGGPGGSTALPKGINVSRYEDEHHQQFFRRVDGALATYTKADPLPICVVGVERWLSHFQSVTTQGGIVATLKGNHDQTPAHELGKLVWPVVAEALSSKRSRALQTLATAVGAQRTASGLGEVWRRAQEGRAELLLVEENYHQAGRLDPASGQLHLTDAVGDGEAGSDGAGMADAVDEVIEAVLAKGGEVVFVDDGALAQHQRVALTLRY
jgi:hypothetical protein